MIVYSKTFFRGLMAAVLCLAVASVVAAPKPAKQPRKPAKAAKPAKSAKPAKPSGSADNSNEVVWKLVYTDDFKGTKLNEKIWSRIEAGSPDWCKNMSLRPDLVQVKGGQLHIYGVKNNDKSADSRSILTGGVKTQGKFAMTYGKIEVRCKLENQRGAWPAIWMTPDRYHPGESWPVGGEIDIIERLNSDDFVYQTVHSSYTRKNNNPPHGGRGKIINNDWNVYGLEWTETELKWFVNGKETFSYKKRPDCDRFQFPWDYPFHLMIDMQLGGSWVGGVDESTLPVAMHIDWVKFYSGSRGGKKFSQFTRPKK